MSDLSFIERSILEKLLGMSSGYVLGFTNRTFQEFVADSVGRDIESAEGFYGSGSKASRLRKFWEIESNFVVGKLLKDLIEPAKEANTDQALIDKCSKVADRLLQGSPVPRLEDISEDLSEKGIDLLIGSIQSAIDRNEPQAGLDRLHTLTIKFLRRVCEQNGIVVAKDKPLHSLMGEYIKKAKANGMVETEMTERILKSYISILEAFNPVRNDHSFAHDNPLLNYNESLLIFQSVTSYIRFIQALERHTKAKASAVSQFTEPDGDDIPF